MSLNEIILLSAITIVSFVYGHFHGKQTFLENITKIASWSAQDGLEEFVQQAMGAEKIFHFGTMVYPGLKYYGLSIFGFQVGYTRIIAFKQIK